MTVRKIKSIGDIPYPIDVGTDALSPLLTAGAALGITGNDAEESAWLTRTSEADGVESVRSIHGRTLVWNQRFSVENGNVNSNQGTKAFDSSTGVWTITSSPTATNAFGFYTLGGAIRGAIGGHKTLVRAKVKLSTAGTVSFGTDTASESFAVASDTFTTVGKIVSPSSTTNIICYTTGGEGLTMQVKEIESIDLTQMFGAGNEPSTVAEFEALFPLPYYEYDAGSLLPVQMEGIESTGFNQYNADENPFENKGFDGTASNTNVSNAGHIAVLPETQYEFRHASISGVSGQYVRFYDASKVELDASTRFNVYGNAGSFTFTTPAGAWFIRVQLYDANNITPAQMMASEPCLHISDPTRNGEYEPYWKQTRPIPAGTLRGAGTVYDELTSTETITRVGVVDLGTLTWVYDTSNTRFNTSGALPDAAKTSDRIDVPCGKYTFAPTGSTDKSIFMYQGAIYVYDSAYTDAAAFKTAMSGVMAHYALATPTATPYDPPLNLTYRTAAGGVERVMVPTGENSAPPTIVTAQGYTAESLRDAALSAIAPIENGLASTNYGVGSYLVHGGQLCRVTTAIATGESITIGTNVTATTVMAEILSLVQ